MIPTDPDRPLLEALEKSGPEQRGELLSELFERNRGRVTSLCMRLTRNESDTADAVQETFVKALQKFEQFRGEARFSTWLYRVATTRCRELARSRSRRAAFRSPRYDATRDAPHLAIEDESVPSPMDGLERDEERLAIREAIDELPGLQRSTVEMRYFEGLAYDRIAELQEVPIGTVKSRLFRAHRALAMRLDDLRVPA